MAHEPNDTSASPAGHDPALDSLDSRIAAARKAENERLAQEHVALSEARGSAMQIASTMVGYPLGGIVIGILLDNFFDTLPWITIILMFLAFIGACIHVVRLNKNSAG